MQINWKKGLLRVWLVASAHWIAAVGWIGVSDWVAESGVRYYYDPMDDLLQKSYFGLSNASRFAKSETLEVRSDDGISVVFISAREYRILPHPVSRNRPIL